MKLYYGNGSCTIEGNARGVEIRYRGAIKITDKTSDNFAIAQQKDGIMIFPIGRGTLSDLFDYVGEFKITSVIVANEEGERESCTIHKILDYSQLLKTKAEDMTIVSENLSRTHTYRHKIAKTSLNQPIIPNLETSRHGGNLYLEDGSKYSGYFHIHLSNNATMTGSEHTEESQELYYKKIGSDTLIPTKNESLIPPTVADVNNAIKRMKRRTRVKKTFTPKKIKNKKGGTISGGGGY